MGNTNIDCVRLEGKHLARRNGRRNPISTSIPHAGKGHITSGATNSGIQALIGYDENRKNLAAEAL